MKNLMLAATMALFLIPAGANFANAADNAEAAGVYKFDKVHTQVLFFVNHLGFSTSEGEFQVDDGSFTFDPAHPEKSNVNVTIDINSLDMDDAKWEEHLKGKDFFNEADYPTMTFKSTDIKVTGDNKADITGDLTLHGVTKPVTLHTIYNKSGVHPFSGEYVSGFSATGEIKRSDFGMNYGIPAIGDDVKIRLEVEGLKQKTADATAE